MNGRCGETCEWLQSAATARGILFQVFPRQILLLFKQFLLINYNFIYLNYIFNLIYNISLLSKLIKINIDFLIAIKKIR